MWQLKHFFHFSHSYIHTHTGAHRHNAHAHTHTHTLTLTQTKILQFFGKIAKSNTRAIDTTLVRKI